ncbi:uncharacterized protein MONOS_11398 [Monocercomonoides exilis]|uniref:uncharacterized protein n=1 Tax=Monocercomonoides exilis TaxID=2049356 RepID=UPI00355A7A60|nr:hypothetical protein MONOS_11398 [Monocercomonoides exilis]|eukprot:MONOS_11398.1-p1 / transcript=MONOS_11398.1 / gene=MONOS_11398 / organism=Monocercomonoides_exilis_PA203 / gene_product=unspecified product / transcript_product=unspecified product / location=Mono_scaffold00569:22308-23006(-) / protein_length=213 / sequence_SO=supercontig / SO=protein_coding / is_pseudo=false
MEMGRGAIGASTTLPSPVVVVGGGVVTLSVMGMKDLDKEETKAIPDEFQNEKEKVDDEEAKITFSSLEYDNQREKLLRLMKLQEIQKMMNEKDEREGRKMEKEENKENKMASEEQQEAKESQTPILTRERKLDCMLNDLANSELDVPIRYDCIKSEENVQFVWKLQEVSVYAAVEERQTRARLNLMSALKSGLKQSCTELRRGNRRNAQKGK